MSTVTIDINDRSNDDIHSEVVDVVSERRRDIWLHDGHTDPGDAVTKLTFKIVDQDRTLTSLDIPFSYGDWDPADASQEINREICELAEKRGFNVDELEEHEDIREEVVVRDFLTEEEVKALEREGYELEQDAIVEEVAETMASRVIEAIPERGEALRGEI